MTAEVDLPGITVLGPNQPPDRFYTGGAKIARFRSAVTHGHRVPEDWVGSTTTLFGEDRLGLTTLPSGQTLASALAADPLPWLGPDHVARAGADSGLLVKLLDAGQRLPVHAHPDFDFAHEHLGLTHGKTEAWIPLEPCQVHLGFRDDVDPQTLARWVHEQDTAALLDATQTLDLQAGDAVLVPAGIPHAIGEGAFLIELQEPTDLSILLEWDGFAIDGATDGHLGLGFGTALGAIDLRGRSHADTRALVRSRSEVEGNLLPGAEEFFRAERWRSSRRLDAGFSVVVVVAGSGTLRSAAGEELALSAGMTLLVPHASGELSLEAGEELEIIRCRPPRPVAPPGLPAS